MDAPFASEVVVDDQSPDRLRLRAEQQAAGQLAKAVLPPEVESKRVPWRHVTAASSVNANADTRRKQKLALVEVRHAAFALPFLPVLHLVRQEARGRIVEIFFVESQGKNGQAA